MSWPTPRRIGLPVLSAVAILAAALGPLWYPAYRSERDWMRPWAYDDEYGAQGRAWIALENATKSRGGKTIAYSGTAIVLPLFGSRLQNRVCYVPLSPGEMPRPIENPTQQTLGVLLARARRNTVDEAFWLEELERRGVDYLYLCCLQDPPAVNPELKIIARHRDRFALRFHEQGVYLFAVRHSGGTD
jgi:hypothetical protein